MDPPSPPNPKSQTSLLEARDLSPPVETKEVPCNETDSGGEEDDDDSFSDVPDIDGDANVLERDDDDTTWIFTCPLSQKTFPSKSQIDNYWLHTFGATLETIVVSQSPLKVSSSVSNPPSSISSDAFFYYCILINYLRSQVAQVKIDNQDDPSSTYTLILNRITPASAFWKCDDYLFPKIPDDPLIRSFRGWNTTVRKADGMSPDNAYPEVESQNYDDDDDSREEEEEDDGLLADPYLDSVSIHNDQRRFVVGGETVPSHEFLTEQARSLKELGAFD